MDVEPRGTAIDSLAQRAYVTAEGELAIIDLEESTLVTTVSLGADPQGVAVNPFTSRVYGALSGEGNLSVVDGLAPLLASLLVLLPFFMTSLWGDILYSYYLALAIAMLSLFGLGAFLGRISRQNVLIAGLKMIIAGAVALVLSYLIESALPASRGG